MKPEIKEEPEDITPSTNNFRPVLQLVSSVKVKPFPLKLFYCFIRLGEVSLY